MSENITSILSGGVTSVVAMIQNPDGGLLKVAVYGFIGGAVGYGGKLLLQHVVSKIKVLINRKRQRKKSKIILLTKNEENQ